MNSNILKLVFFIHLSGCYVFYNNTIHALTYVNSILLYILYTDLYKLSFTNTYFAEAITPLHYIDPIQGSHKLISYGFSTLHAIFISLCSTLYLLNIIDNYDIKQVFFISISYYSADIYYIIYSTKKLTKLDYFTICHHNVMIIMYYIIFILDGDGSDLENSLLYYINRGLLAEYSVFALNYTWYLVNTKQDNTNSMFISSLLTLILYFITRVVNFTRLIFNFWNDGLFLSLVLMMPLFLINYYWFYKLMCKAYRIYKKLIN